MEKWEKRKDVLRDGDVYYVRRKRSREGHWIAYGDYRPINVSTVREAGN